MNFLINFLNLKKFPVEFPEFPVYENLGVKFLILRGDYSEHIVCQTKLRISLKKSHLRMIFSDFRFSKRTIFRNSAGAFYSSSSKKLG